jgi:methylthioribose-1-phosphate isomerase
MSIDQQLPPFTRHLSIEVGQDGWSVRLIDQRTLPNRLTFHRADSAADILASIRQGMVRGPARVAVAAAYGLALAARRNADMAAVMAAFYTLIATDLHCPRLRAALDRMREVMDITPKAERAERAMAEADDIAREDLANHMAIGRHGLPLLRTQREGQPPSGRILLAAQSGWLSAVGWGAASAALYMAWEQREIWQLTSGLAGDEMPPPAVLAITPLAAWELAEAGIAHAVIDQGGALQTLAYGGVDQVWLALERATPMGDLAVAPELAELAGAARQAGIPVIAALPSVGINWAAGKPSAIAAAALHVLSGDAVDWLVTERGICRADSAALANLFPEQLSPFGGAANEA